MKLKLSKKDLRYVIASLVLLVMAGVAIGIFAKQSIEITKKGGGGRTPGSAYALSEDENVEDLEMERVDPFAQGQAKETIIIKNKEQAENVLMEMNQIISLMEEESSASLLVGENDSASNKGPVPGLQPVNVPSRQ